MPVSQRVRLCTAGLHPLGERLNERVFNIVKVLFGGCPVGAAHGVGAAPVLRPVVGVPVALLRLTLMLGVKRLPHNFGPFGGRQPFIGRCHCILQ